MWNKHYTTTGSQEKGCNLYICNLSHIGTTISTIVCTEGACKSYLIILSTSYQREKAGVINHSIRLHLLKNKATNNMEQVSLWIVWNQIEQKRIPHSIDVYLAETTSSAKWRRASSEVRRTFYCYWRCWYRWWEGIHVCNFPIYNMERA